MMRTKVLVLLGIGISLVLLNGAIVWAGEVSFSCSLDGQLVVTVIAPGVQDGVICNVGRSGRTIEIPSGTHTLSISCMGPERCRHFVNIRGGEFVPAGKDGSQTDGSLSPGHATSPRFRAY